MMRSPGPGAEAVLEGEWEEKEIVADRIVLLRLGLARHRDVRGATTLPASKSCTFSATAFASGGGTEFATWSIWFPLHPSKTYSSGKLCSRAASRTVMVRFAA